MDSGPDPSGRPGMTSLRRSASSVVIFDVGWLADSHLAQAGARAGAALSLSHAAIACRRTPASAYRAAVSPLFGVPAGGRPAAGDRRIVRGAGARRARPGVVGGHRLGEDLYDGACHRPHRPAGHRPRAEQDLGGAALWRDEELLPGERGRVFRLLLRLLPAGSLRPAHRYLCRKRVVAERADRPDAPFGDPGHPPAA